VTDQHHRPFKFIECHRQRLAGGEVEVIGRLVEQQQVGALPDNHRQHQPRLFSAGQRTDGLFDHVAAEIERAKEVAQILLAADSPSGWTLLCQPYHVLERIILRHAARRVPAGRSSRSPALAFAHRAAERGQVRAMVLTSVDLPCPLAPRMPIR
jgi:hypothetical protein